jgi:GNAT superfamily N-acetyltransferase
MRIRPARPDEAAALTGLVLRSKAYWGYDEEFLARCRQELALLPEELETLRTHLAERDGGAPLGVVTIRGAPPEGILDHLYVEPSAMGLGVGRMLLRAARDIARSSGFSALLIHSDPNAEAFYLREGAVRAGSVPSGSVSGRMLPLLRLDLRE